MKTTIGILLALWLFAIAGSFVIAQVATPFWHWPVLYKAANELVVKRAIDDQGNPTDYLYFRIGWGPCLLIDINEWQTLIDATQSDRYINMRDYADSKYYELSNVPFFHLNCPKAPLELKPTWRNSRPTYYWRYDEVTANWIRGKKSPYRIRTDVLVSCLRQNAKKTDGSATNYWRLDNAASVYNATGEYVISSLDNVPYGLLSICREQDVNITGLRF